MNRAEKREPIKPAAGFYTEAGDSKFMRRKLESVRRELDANGSIQDREAYQALLRERIQVKARYDDAARWLRAQQREAEARRFELLRDGLPPIRTEKQLLAEMVGHSRSRADMSSEPVPSRRAARSPCVPRSQASNESSSCSRSTARARSRSQPSWVYQASPELDIGVVLLSKRYFSPFMMRQAFLD